MNTSYLQALSTGTNALSKVASTQKVDETTSTDNGRVKTLSQIASTLEETEVSANTTGRGEEFSTFLTLLTAQIRNQDPLAPLDSTQFVQQLATFSGLELQASANDTLEEIASLLAVQLYEGTSNV